MPITTLQALRSRWWFRWYGYADRADLFDRGTAEDIVAFYHHLLASSKPAGKAWPAGSTSIGLTYAVMDSVRTVMDGLYDRMSDLMRHTVDVDGRAAPTSQTVAVEVTCALLDAGIPLTTLPLGGEMTAGQFTYVMRHPAVYNRVLARPNAELMELFVEHTSFLRLSDRPIPIWCAVYLTVIGRTGTGTFVTALCEVVDQLRSKGFDPTMEGLAHHMGPMWRDRPEHFGIRYPYPVTEWRVQHTLAKLCEKNHGMAGSEVERLLAKARASATQDV